MTSALAATQALEAKYLLNTYDRFAVQFERGEGVYLYDSNGKRYLDFLGGIGVNALGYNHPAITAAIAEQSQRLVHISNLFHHPYQGLLAKKLAETSGLDRAFFCNSGTEAWEAALKLTRLAAQSKSGKPRPKLIAMENSFHGRSIGSLSTTGQVKYRAPFEPLMPEVLFVRYNDVQDLVSKFDDSTAAVMLETVQGEGGVVPATSEFLAAARHLTAASGALLVLDEIQCGMGRTGKWFAYQHYDVKPDMVTLAKPIAGGLPLGALLCTEEVAAAMRPGLHGTTFGGGPLACAIALKVVETIESQGLLARVTTTGSYLQTRLHDLKERDASIKAVRGMGLMVGAELHDAELAKAVVNEMLAQGFIINRTHDTVLRFLPPFIIGEKEIDAMINALSAVLSAKKKTEPVTHA